MLPDTPESRAMAGEARKLLERVASELAKGGREDAVRGFVEAVNGRGSWHSLSSEERTILLDNASTLTRAEARPSLACDDIRKFQFPIFQVTGENSPKRYGEMLAAMRTCATVSIGEPVVISNASHAMNRQNPAAFNAAVLGFLSGR